MAEAKNPAQKQNQAFVRPLKTLLTKTKHNDPAICSAMMIQSQVLDQIPKELLKTLEAPSRDDLDDDSNISSDVSSSDNSNTETAQPKPIKGKKQEKTTQNLTTDKEQQRAL
jgi:hypothetical protein